MNDITSVFAQDSIYDNNSDRVILSTGDDRKSKLKQCWHSLTFSMLYVTFNPHQL